MPTMRPPPASSRQGRRWRALRPATFSFRDSFVQRLSKERTHGTDVCQAYVQSLYTRHMSAHDADRGPVRIGELSRRVGVTPEVLRAWERRYGILSPGRTEGGFRLYGEDDERRIRRMLEHLEQGLSAAEAARLARAEPPAQLDPVAAEAADG